jgi:hypothetical protein
MVRPSEGIAMGSPELDSAFDDDYLNFFAERLGDERCGSELATTMSLLALKPVERVADVACGHGRISNRLAREGTVVQGLDAESPFPRDRAPSGTRVGCRCCL